MLGRTNIVHVLKLNIWICEET